MPAKISAAIRQCAARIKLFLCDMDGVLIDGWRPNLECAGMTALWNWETCLPSGKRRRVAALQIGTLLTDGLTTIHIRAD